MDTHWAILNLVKKILPNVNYNGDYQTTSTDLVSCNDNALLRQLFTNFRAESDGLQLTHGLQLSHYGLAVMSACFINWQFRNPKGFIVKPKHLLFFDRNCTMPWYLDSKDLILFERQLAMRTKLVGDLDNLLTAFTDAIP